MKLIESVVGTVTMVDGTQREAYKNTYKVTTFNGDGTVTNIEEIRIEFLLFINVNTSRTRKYRKTSPKQAATFNVNRL